MRLTLRTLLAYMDDVLEPADREEIAKKIEASDFANDLIHRTKDTVRRLRLSAPQVVGSGIGLDPNTVAEYLDNTLPPDSVADFERICLESDVHLAEVASSHHVLTMVLGEPAEVDPASRPRLYAIPSQAAQLKNRRVEPAHSVPSDDAAYVTSTAAAGQAPPEAYLSTTVGTHEHHVPDYLRASSWSRYRLPLAILAATLLVAVTAVLVFGLTDWFGGKESVATNTAASQSAPTTEAPTDDTDTSQPSAERPGDELATDELLDDQSDSGVTDTSTAEGMDSPQDDDARTTSSTLDSSPMQPLFPSFGNSLAEADDGEEEDRYAVPDADDEQSSVEPDFDPVAPYRVGPETSTDNTRITDEPSAASLPSMPLPDAVAPPADPMAGDEAADSSTDADMRIASAGGADVDSIVDAEDVDASEQLQDEELELGTYLDAKNILVRYDGDQGAWLRMMPRATVGAGDRLLALPAFYPRITLTSGIHLKLAGGTMIDLLDADPADDATASLDPDVPTIDLKYGKLVIINTASEEAPLQLALGQTTSTVRLVPGATLAIEAMRSYVPGRDPRQSPSPLVAQLYVPDGSIDWTVGGEDFSIEAPGQWQLAGGRFSAVDTPQAFPEWIDSEPVEQRSEKLWGVPVVEQSLDTTRPVGNQLLELYQGSRRREVKSLVARSAVYVGLFVPFVEALRDSDQKAMWKTHIETLRSAMALGPESAENIHETLVEQRGRAAAADLYEMLCGYSPEQVGRTQAEVEAGAIPRLIDRLEDESLDYRVLAVQDLWEICNKRFLTDPTASPAERTRGVRIWRDRLESGELAAGLEAP